MYNPSATNEKLIVSCYNVHNSKESREPRTCTQHICQAKPKRLKHYPIQPSYKTIYRAIYAAMFDTPEQRRSEGNRGARRKLRHRGKPRRPKGYVSNRGKIPISHELSERPIEANERSRFGDWEADTIVGYNHKSGLLTLVDRKSRFLFAEKLTRLGNKEMEAAMIGALQGQPLHTITPMACFASILQKATNTCRNIFFNYVALGLTIRASKERKFITQKIF